MKNERTANYTSELLAFAEDFAEFESVRLLEIIFDSKAEFFRKRFWVLQRRDLDGSEMCGDLFFNFLPDAIDALKEALSETYYCGEGKRAKTFETVELSNKFMNYLKEIELAKEGM